MLSTYYCSLIDHLKPQPFWILFLFSIGLISIFKNSILIAKWIFTTLLRPPKNLKKDYGSWALITGSTDGIGKAMAYELAKKGLNLILISRNSQRLEQVSNQIQSLFPNIHIKILALDFSLMDDNRCYVRIQGAIKELDVGLLVNNVGVTYSSGAKFFHEVEKEDWMNVVRVNLKATTLVTRAVVEGMIKRKRGSIVNIGSGAAIVVPSHPLYAVYAATKAYVDQLSRSLYVEYGSWGIHVQCQVPLYVSTKMASRVAKIQKSSFFVPNAESYAKAAVNRIGYEVRCTPWWTHSLQWTFASFLPQSLLDHWRLSIGISRRRDLQKN
ncbi:OLC1v1028773C1 [Oldenlandia corymbosa var. corymbosa]|uniref:OLC1v1028773C1 n=1 Tax=Oldenlandia corymbosa var. corymbosa TaxID=529605 RepID=A0AAV1CDL3_OLDCO|nr:OLC1v1028773C1 [Oldenlandia corymbosa var. corymbosa]